MEPQGSAAQLHGSSAPVGRPGDLQRGCSYKQPAMHALEALVQVLGDKLDLHTVGFGREHMWWLDMLATSAAGRFHK